MKTTDTSNDITRKFDNLSHGALVTLNALVKSSAGNGHDFGMMDDANAQTPFDSKQFAGFISHLGDFIAHQENLTKQRGCSIDGIQFELTKALTDNPSAMGTLSELAKPATDDTTTKPATDDDARPQAVLVTFHSYTQEVVPRTLAGLDYIVARGDEIESLSYVTLAATGGDQ